MKLAWRIWRVIKRVKFDFLRINLPFKYHGRDLNFNYPKWTQIPTDRCLCAVLTSLSPKSNAI